jgi:hypothetical protein
MKLRHPIINNAHNEVLTIKLVETKHNPRVKLVETKHNPSN